MLNVANSKSKRPVGAPPGSHNNPDGRPIKRKEPSDYFLGVRIPKRIKELIDARAGAQKDTTQADVVIEAIEIAKAYGWQLPHGHEDVHAKPSK